MIRTGSRIGHAAAPYVRLDQSSLAATQRLVTKPAEERIYTELRRSGGKRSSWGLVIGLTAANRVQ